MIDSVTKWFRPIAIHAPTKSTNASGEPIETYALVGTVDGLIRPLNESERVASDQQQTKATHRMYCRPTMTLAPHQRIIDRGKTYDIKGVVDVNNFGALLHVDCTEVVV